MSAPLDLGSCLSFINCQLTPGRGTVLPLEKKPRWRAVTISREMGTRGHEVAEALAQHLQAQAGKDSAPWMVFDRNLVEKVLEDHHLPARLAKFMLEDRISAVQDTLDELFGLHPPTWTLVEKTAETILQLVELGNVIIIGRGGNIVTNRLDYVFHVRLVGFLEARAEVVQAERHIDEKSALALIQREDEGRRKFLKQHFHRNIDDPRLYHLVINTSVIGDRNAGKLIAEAMHSSSRVLETPALSSRS